jgi:membrane fusion protein (multidrug efflux system)
MDDQVDRGARVDLRPANVPRENPRSHPGKRDDQKDGEDAGRDDDDDDQDQDQDGEKPGKKPFVILGLILLVLAIIGTGYYFYAGQFATTTDAQIDGSIHQIAPRISGQIERVLVDDNQHVNAGEVLAVIDPRDQRIALERAQAQQAQSAASLAQAQAQLAVSHTNAAQADAQVREAQADFIKAQHDLARYTHINQAAISQQQLDQALDTARVDQAKLYAAQQNALGSGSSISTAQAQLLSAQAALHAAAVAVADAQLQLSYTIITAPSSGHVSQRTVRSGNVVAAGTPLMAVIGDDVWVTANYRETDLPGIHPGLKVKVTIDAIPGRSFNAHVDSIQYGTGSVFSLLPAENATGNYVKIVQRVPVKIVFNDQRILNYLLAPGMSAEPSITLQNH